MNIHLLRPEALLALLPIVVLLTIAWRRRAGDGGGWEEWVDAHLLRHLRVVRRGRNSRPWLLGLGLLWGALVVALAGPSWSRLPEASYRLQRPPLVIVLDLSRSMTAPDPAPSRLEVAKAALRDLLAGWPGGEVGLVVFAATAHRVLPLTEESSVVVALLDSLDTELMPMPHSRPVTGLQLARALAGGVNRRDGDVLLVTDGGGASLVGAARRLRAEGLRLSILAVGEGRGRGSADDGAPPGRGADRGALAEAARAGGGMLFSYPMAPATRDAFARRGAEVTESEPSSGSVPVWRDQGGWLVLGLLPLAALVFRRGWLLAIPLTLSLAAPPVQALEWNDLWQRRDQRAMEAWRRGDYHRAEALFDDPLWKGIARYRIGDYAGAAETFAAAGGPVGHFNRGVALMRLEAWGAAREAFREALRLDPGDRDARFNRRLLDWYLERTVGSPGAGETASPDFVPGRAEAAPPEPIRQQEKPLAQAGPDRDPPGAADIPEAELPKGKLGGAAMLLEQGKAHQGPESDTAGEARSSRAPAGGVKSGGGEYPAAASRSRSGESGSTARRPPRARLGDDPDGEPAAAAREGGGVAGESGAGERDGRPRTSPADRVAEDAMADHGRSAGAGGTQMTDSQERRQALEQWLAGLPSDARELLRREFRRNFERSAPELDGVEPW